MSYWIAARCHASRENIIADRLKQEISALVYSPKVRLRSPSGRPIESALFATYFFVDLQQSPPWQRLARFEGVTSIVNLIKVGG